MRKKKIVGYLILIIIIMCSTKVFARGTSGHVSSHSSAHTSTSHSTSTHSSSTSSHVTSSGSSTSHSSFGGGLFTGWLLFHNSSSSPNSSSNKGITEEQQKQIYDYIYEKTNSTELKEYIETNKNKLTIDNPDKANEVINKFNTEGLENTKNLIKEKYIVKDNILLKIVIVIILIAFIIAIIYFAELLLMY